MLLLLLRFLSHLPLAVLHGAGAAAGVLSYALQPGVRAKARRNLEAAGLYSRALAWRSAAEAGKAVLETPYIWFRPDAVLSRRTDATQLAHAISSWRQTSGPGVGAIFLTPHLGSFELSARAFAILSPITVLYKPPRRADLHEVLRIARHRPPRLKAVPTDAGGIRNLLRALRQGECIGVLPDQVPMAGEGSWAPFFGRRAFTMTLPARLAERSGARVFVLATRRRRLARGWVIECRPFDGDPTPARVNAVIEAIIRAAPDQYYWDYNRYKAPPGVAPLEEVGAS